MLQIKKYKPSFKLEAYIDAYWSIKNISNYKVSIPIVPDGCMDIIYQNNRLLCIGVMSEAIFVEAKPLDHSFGIRFKPAVLAQLLNIKANDFKDKKIALEKISLSLFNLLNFQEEDERVKVTILNKIFEKLFKDISLNRKIIKAIEFIFLNKGDITIKQLEESMKLSSRQIERLFKNYVGYSPKKFCNIIRFFTLFNELIKTKRDNLSFKAYDYGYCDQSHLNKEFKKFSNFTPTNEIMSIFYKTKV